MIDEIRKIKSTPRELRQFAVVMCGACACIAALLLWRHKESWIAFAAGAAGFLFFRFVFTRALLPLQKVWMTLAVMMGWVMSRIILGILFYAVFTAIGIIGRIFKKEFLELHASPAQKSYWKIRTDAPRTSDSYEKQY